MLWSMKALRGYSIRATDDVLGSVRDILFDDRAWIVRYLVVDTRRWLFGRDVLIAPEVLGHPDAERQEFPVRLTRRQVRESPGLDSDKPVSRQYEDALFAHYGWSPYWAAPMMAEGVPPTTAGMVAGDMPPAREAMAEALEREQGDRHLRSAHEITGYRVHGSDGEIGHLSDLVLDEAGWCIRYAVVDTGGWWSGRSVLVAPAWITQIRWADSTVHVDLTQSAVRESPGYDPSSLPERSYEERLYQHYSRIPYW